jgi:hypothetical protein
MNKTAKHLPKIIAQAGLLSLTFWMGAVCGGDSRRAAPRPVPPEIPAAVPADQDRAAALPLVPVPTAPLTPVPAVAPLPVFLAPTLLHPATGPVVVGVKAAAEIAPPPAAPAMAPTEPATAKAACQPAGQPQCSYQSCRRGLFRGRR